MGDRVVYKAYDADSSRWDGFPLRTGDIVISTPSKAGTTWTQMLCALVVFDGPDLPAPLDELSPWLDQTTLTMEDLSRTLAAQTHRRFLKTHTPLDGLPLDDRVTYLCVGRDPRDVAVSLAHHRRNMDRERFRALRAAAGVAQPPDAGHEVPDPDRPDELAAWLRQWIDDPRPGTEGVENLGTILHHYTTFWAERHRPNVALFHFADYQADLAGELSRLAEVLGCRVTRERAEELAGEATLDRMRERAGELAPLATQHVWKDVRRFFRSGRSGEWRDHLTGDDLARYHQRIASLVPVDLAAWLHRDEPESQDTP